MPRNPSAIVHAPIPASSTMAGDLSESKFQAGSANTGAQKYALGFGTITWVDYAKLEVTVRIETGETYQPLPIPITFPGAGNRHFFGALPEVGDVCVLGWGMMESGLTRRPIILGWLLPGSTAGYDWLPTQPVTPEEFNLNPKMQGLLEGLADRVRHKLRHMEPGNIVASSSQGSDLVLNESVLLTNRRANEIRLRDQDQALVIRTLQQFHAMAGARVYAGMVQRDATFLPTQMFSDGIDWDAPKQVGDDGAPINTTELAPDSQAATNLAPNKVFLRDADGVAISGIGWEDNVDPYEFLKRGLFITTGGQALGNVASDAVYGGKPFYRVSQDLGNAVIDPTKDTLTEYRIEVAHTSDGVLPVSEETDNFDADRLPATNQLEASPQGGSSNVPFIEIVYGSVVGNDPFTPAGRNLYGLPIRPKVFDGDTRTPVLASGVGTSMESHAASLFKIAPPLGAAGESTFWSTTKDGRVMASLAGPGTSWSLESVFSAGARLGLGATPTGESIRADADGSIALRAITGRQTDNVGVELTSDNGAVRVYAGGSSTVGGTVTRAITGDDSNLPGLILESRTNTLIKAARTLTLAANALKFTNTANLTLDAGSGVNLRSGDGMTMSSKVMNVSVTGRMSQTFGGPKDSLPTNTPLRSTQFTGSPVTGLTGGTVDQYECLLGDRSEKFVKGSHTTTMVVGDQTYTCASGKWTASAAANSLAVDYSSGIRGVVATGTMSFSASAGSTSISGSTSVMVSSQGQASLQGSMVQLQAKGGKVGGIISEADIDPISGRPFSAFRMGSPTHRLSVG